MKSNVFDFLFGKWHKNTTFLISTIIPLSLMTKQSTVFSQVGAFGSTVKPNDYTQLGSFTLKTVLKKVFLYVKVSNHKKTQQNLHKSIEITGSLSFSACPTQYNVSVCVCFTNYFVTATVMHPNKQQPIHIQLHAGYGTLINYMQCNLFCSFINAQNGQGERKYTKQPPMLNGVLPPFQFLDLLCM